MNIPNLITIARIIAVPLIVYLILSQAYLAAFILFVIAGISDGIDGFIARRFDMGSELGAYLDPVADKVLMGSIYITLAFAGAIPLWLVIMVVSRDILIVGGVLVAWVADAPLTMHPLMVSKINTAVQIAYAAIILGHLAFTFLAPGTAAALAIGVGLLTFVSAIAYVQAWGQQTARS